MHHIFTVAKWLVSFFIGVFFFTRLLFIGIFHVSLPLLNNVPSFSVLFLLRSFSCCFLCIVSSLPYFPLINKSLFCLIWSLVWNLYKEHLFPTLSLKLSLVFWHLLGASVFTIQILCYSDGSIIADVNDTRSLKACSAGNKSLASPNSSRIN